MGEPNKSIDAVMSQTRLKFEEWAKSSGLTLPLDRDTGYYASRETSVAFCAWSAGYWTGRESKPCTC